MGLISVVLAISIPFLGFGDSEPKTPEEALAKFRSDYRKATTYGAEAKVIFKLVDEEGIPVEGARYDISLWYRSMARSTAFKGETDKSGIVVVEGKCTEDIPGWTFRKDGFYDSTGRLLIARYEPDAIKDGKWLPYGQEKVVVLKRIKNPIPMYAHDSMRRQILKELDKRIGFDMEVDDFVEPYGKGKVVDFYLCATWNGEDDYYKNKYSLEITFPNENDGVLVCQRDLESRYTSPYHAPKDGEYKPSIKFAVYFDPKAHAYVKPLAVDKMLIMRTRTKKDASGVNISCYARVNLVAFEMTRLGAPGEKDAPTGMRINVDYRFNPTLGDTNLEFNKKNLLLDERGYPRGFNFYL